MPGREQRLDGIGIARKRAVGGQERREETARGVTLAAGGGRPWCRRHRLAAAIEEDLDPRRALRRGGAEPAGAALAQRRQHAFDVLAGAEPVDAVVDAAAGIGEGVEAAHLDLVPGAAARLGAKGAEHRMVRLQGLDGDDFGGAAPAPQCDLVLVAGQPAQKRRPLEHGARLARRAARSGRRTRSSRGRAHELRIGTPSHGGTLGGRARASTGRPTTQTNVPSSIGAPVTRLRCARAPRLAP